MRKDQHWWKLNCCARRTHMKKPTSILVLTQSSQCCQYCPERPRRRTKCCSVTRMTVQIVHTQDIIWVYSWSAEPRISKGGAGGGGCTICRGFGRREIRTSLEYCGMMWVQCDCYGCDMHDVGATECNINVMWCQSDLVSYIFDMGVIYLSCARYRRDMVWYVMKVIWRGVWYWYDMVW